jgi:hypothetical protein
MTAWTAPDRAYPSQAADERESLDAWVEFHRATLLMKCAGLEPEQLALRSCPPSSLSLLGLVRHLTEVEAWFHDFDEEPPGEWYTTDADPEGTEARSTPSKLLALRRTSPPTTRASLEPERRSKTRILMTSRRSPTTVDRCPCAGSTCT